MKLFKTLLSLHSIKLVLISVFAITYLAVTSVKSSDYASDGKVTAVLAILGVDKSKNGSPTINEKGPASDIAAVTTRTGEQLKSTLRRTREISLDQAVQRKKGGHQEVRVLKFQPAYYTFSASYSDAMCCQPLQGETMLQSINDLKGYDILAVDGKIGNIEEFYFDDQNLVVRYVVANVGNWLTGKQNLISPVFVTHLERDKREIRISLTKDQVSRCPGVDKHKPVSRQMEKIVSDYYGAKYYWDERPNLSPGQLARINATSAMVKSAIETGSAAAPAPDVHLRSMQEASMYAITAVDGDLGQVEDFFLEMDDWSIRYVGVNTGKWLPRKHVLLSAMSLGPFNWSERSLTVNLTRSQIENSPDYDKVTEISREYETRLHKHYNLQTGD